MFMMYVLRGLWNIFTNNNSEINQSSTPNIIADYLNYRLNKDGLEWLNSPSLFDNPNETNKAVRSLADEFEERYLSQFDDMVQQIHITPNTAYPKFRLVADELFISGINWGRVVALLSFGGCIAVECVENDMEHLVDAIYGWLSQYVQNDLEPWIKRNGNWGGLVEFAKIHNSSKVNASQKAEKSRQRTTRKERTTKVPCDNDETSSSSHVIVNGKIKYFDNNEIGCGSTARIYGGRFEDRIDIAVKRIPVREADALKTKQNLDEVLLASREIQVHQHTESYHEYIVRYFCSEIEKAGPNIYILIALERCDGTLLRYIERHGAYKDLSHEEIMVQLAKGLTYLHERGILHRDLKPSNILLKGNSVKLSDFSMAKFKRENDDAILSNMFSISNEFGTLGWIAPEAYRDFQEKGDATVTAACDVFSLGLIFYYVCSGGKRAFVDQDSVQNNRMDLSGLINNFTREDLIRRMINTDPKQRPNAVDISKHPALWAPKKVLEFYNETSNFLMNSHHFATHYQLNGAAKAVHGGNWTGALSPAFLYEINTSTSRRGRAGPQYDPTSVVSLLRLVRNYHQHYDKLPESVRRDLGDLPAGYLEYFSSRFPQLLMSTYMAMKVHSKEERLKEFY